MQAPHPRNTHTAVAIKQAKHYPMVNLHSEQTQTAAPRPADKKNAAVIKTKKILQIKFEKQFIAEYLIP